MRSCYHRVASLIVLSLTFSVTRTSILPASVSAANQSAEQHTDYAEVRINFR